MIFSNLYVVLLLTALWPFGLLALLAASAWLERFTLVPDVVVPRRIRRMERRAPEAVEAMVLEETAQVVAAYWSATGRRPAVVPLDPAARPKGHALAPRPGPGRTGQPQAQLPAEPVAAPPPGASPADPWPLVPPPAAPLAVEPWAIEPRPASGWSRPAPGPAVERPPGARPTRFRPQAGPKTRDRSAEAWWDPRTGR